MGNKKIRNMCQTNQLKNITEDEYISKYYNFYRFYATKQWYTCAHREEVIEDDHDWSQNVIFWQKFSKMFKILDKSDEKWKSIDL